jgi:hypothetical protein
MNRLFGKPKGDVIKMDDEEEAVVSDHSADESDEKTLTLSPQDIVNKPKTIRFVKITCRSLRSVYPTGNHPYVVIQFDGHEVRTSHILNGGAHPVFENLELSMTVDKSAIKKKEMTVTAYVYNDEVAVHPVIGSGTVSVAEVLKYDPKQDVPIPVDLYWTDKKGNNILSGRLEIFVNLAKTKNKVFKTVKKIATLNAFKTAGAAKAILSRKEASPQVEQQPMVKPRVIRFVSANCYNLTGGETDPFIVFEFDGHEVKTHRLSHARSTAAFPDLDLSLVAEKASIKEKELAVILFDHNDLKAHTLIGRGSIPIATLLKYEPGQEVPFTLQLLCPDKRGAVATTGNVDFTLTMDPKDTKNTPSTASMFTSMMSKPISAVAAATGPPPGPSVLRIDRISCVDLVNIEIFGKNDVFVVLQFDDRECKTSVIENAGDSASYEKLGFRFGVSEASLQEKEMLVEVYDHHELVPSQLIGSAMLNLSSMLPFKRKGEEREFTVSLLRTRGKSKMAGKVTLWMSLDSEGKPNSTEIGLKRLSEGGGESGKAQRRASYNPLLAFQGIDTNEAVEDTGDVDVASFARPKTIRFLRVDCRNLRLPNNKGGLNAAVTVDFAGQRRKSAFVESAGPDIMFEDVSEPMTVEKDSLEDGEVTVTVHHLAGKTEALLGTGSASIASVLQWAKGEVLKVSVDLEWKDKKGKSGPGGTAEVYVVLLAKAVDVNCNCCVIS